MTLTNYRTLGRSGLVVSPLALGTMTFGTARWGSDEGGSRAVFDAYVDAGGNFVDTADVYSGGVSEAMIGQFIADRALRDRIVLATKSGFNTTPGNPHAGGNGRKAIHAAIDGSLRRLATDHIDLYWLHVWDTVTPVEELIETFGGLVRAGKIRYYGLSNVPAWVAARWTTLAAAHGVPGPIALQLEYSLTERSIENEFVPMARDLGLGILPWSPLDGGFLTGKYQRGDKAPEAAGRLAGANPFGTSKFTDRNWDILDALRTVAAEAERPPAKVALAWALARPGIAALLIGASRPEQLAENIAALDLVLTPPQSEALDTASTPAPTYPYPIFAKSVNRMVFGGADVARWR